MPKIQELEKDLVGAYDEMLGNLTRAKKLESEGFPSPKSAAEYLADREELFKNLVEMEKISGSVVSQEIAGLHAKCEALAKDLMATKDEPKILTKEEFKVKIALTVKAMWKRDFQSMIRLGGGINTKGENSDEFDSPASFAYDEASGIYKMMNPVTKTAIGSPLTGGSDTGQYVINPVYERELIRYAMEKSTMGSLVRRFPMSASTVYFPRLNYTRLTLTWHTPSGSTVYAEMSPTYQEAGKPSFGTRLTLQAATLAGYIPWFDLFEDDMDVNVELGGLFMEYFQEAYGLEFDRQVLTSNANPFTGVTLATDVKVVYIDDVYNVNVGELQRAPQSVGYKDRSPNARWFFHDTMISQLAARRNSQGDFIYQVGYGLTEPERIIGYPVSRAAVLNPVESMVSGSVVGVFYDPRNTIWGDRMGMEIKRYNATSENLLHGEEFIRFRKRDAFLQTKTDLAVIVKVR
jgi:HK97 family phage major capsid protein